ncbi:MAG TPA: succinylglutamate desuccinylase/aspartoacylase family protein [Candidatus Paceibacterota bacterium]
MKKQILFILATHEDEAFSLDVFKKLEKAMPKDLYGYNWVIGNKKALKKGVRFVDADLNRSAPGNSNSSVYEERRAAELIKLANEYNFIIDIHGTVSNAGIFTLIPKPTLQNILFAMTLPIKRNVLWYSRRSLRNGPIVQFCRPPALEIECGPKDDQKTNVNLEAILKDILKMLAKPAYEEVIKRLNQKTFFSVYGSQKEWDKNLRDFQLARINNEEFIPLLVSQYKDIACYKMKKVNFQDLFIY